MAAVTTAMVKELRDLTGAGIMACKNALVECEGDIDKAVEVLRKSGEAKAVKKAGRIAAEGLVALTVKDDKNAAIAEVNSETDFVAKTDKFKNFVNEVVEQVYASDAVDVDELKEDKLISDPTKTVGEELVNQIATIGENIKIRRFARIKSEGLVVGYIHAGGKIGVLVEAEAENNDANKEALRNIAMQVAAMNPQYISRMDMSEEELANLREITIDSSLNTPDTLPKPILNKLIATAVEGELWSKEDIATYEEQKNNMNYLFNFLSIEAKAAIAGLAMKDKEIIAADKIFSGLVEGRFSKQLKEICLLDQTYVKAEDGKQSVEKYLQSVDKNIKLLHMVRFEVGEGIEKKSENFAEEVAKQMGL